jgi:hypothetical protein
MTFVVAAIAARYERLLALSTAKILPKGCLALTGLADSPQAEALRGA